MILWLGFSIRCCCFAFQLIFSLPVPGTAVVHEPHQTEGLHPVNWLPLASGKLKDTGTFRFIQLHRVKDQPSFQSPMGSPSFPHCHISLCPILWTEAPLYASHVSGMHCRLPMHQRDKVLQAVADGLNEGRCELVFWRDTVGPERLFWYEQGSPKQRCW